ncbi:hypothetical protein [uncultured Methylobacterium sp.]|uniref:hypothetical protein n=1 Tax=uncultured Methylobacterium sp. TaxID=157278 RepID=UPI0026376D28|nr:hypothetical protein [uncultured Methylobacterium sp.]
MEIEQVAELARAVAALPQGHQDFFNGMVADERAKAVEAERIAKLRGMPDWDVIEHAVRGGTAIGPDLGDLVVLAPSILRVLSEAGFVRWPADFQGEPQAFFAAIRGGFVPRSIVEDFWGVRASQGDPGRLAEMREELAKGALPPTWATA